MLYVKTGLKRDMRGLGLNAFIIHYGMSGSLPGDADGHLKEVSFHIRTAHVQSFKQCCDLVGNKHRQILRYSALHYLSLMHPALERICKLFRY